MTTSDIESMSDVVTWQSLQIPASVLVVPNTGVSRKLEEEQHGKEIELDFDGTVSGACFHQ